jgi:hypothetical protein
MCIQQVSPFVSPLCWAITLLKQKSLYKKITVFKHLKLSYLSFNFSGFSRCNKISYKKSITKGLLKLCIAYKVAFFELLFFRNKKVKKGFIIDFGYKLVVFHLALIILTDKASFLAL